MGSAEVNGEKDSRPGPSVVSRVAAILCSFTPARPALTLSDISRLVDFPLSTVHRLVAELVEHGALERDEIGRYRVGLRVRELGTLAIRTADVREASMPFMGDVYAATGQNVVLAVPDGLNVLYLERMSGPNSVGMRSQVATRMPFHATGVGLVLLAHAPWEIRQRVLSTTLKSYTPHTLTNPVQLRRVLDAVKRQGFAVSDRQIEEISISVAAPIFDAQGQAVAAISIVAPSTTDWRAYSTTVIAAARGISRALGANPKTERGG